jgi:hypothetical protein
MFNFKKDKDRVGLSIPQERELYGIKIRKLYIGEYLKALNVIKNLPEILLKDIFPGADLDELFDKFKNMDENLLFEITGKMIVIIPEQMLKLIASLLDCEYEYIRDNLTPNELLEVVMAVWEINDFSPFFTNFKKILEEIKSKILGSLTNTGSRTG